MHVKVARVLRLLAHQHLVHREGFAQAVFGSSSVPTNTQATPQPNECLAVFVRARTQWSTLWQGLDASQQCAEASVGSTYLASLQLVLTQPAFAQILRSCEPSTFLRPSRCYCLTYAPP